jgi:ASC-1-like (ASCH) protein
MMIKKWTVGYGVSELIVQPDTIDALYEFRIMNISMTGLHSKFKKYKTIEECLTAEGLHHVLPGVSSVEEAKAIYASFPGYTKRIQQHGLVAIWLGKRLY